MNNEYKNDSKHSPKSNKTMVLIMIGIICALVALIVFLLVRMGGQDSREYDEKQVENISEPVEKPENESSKKIAKSTVSRFKNVGVGEYITFGKYEQDNNRSNGKEEIEWLVLDKKDDKILVISKYALDCVAYNDERKDITWETCTLRNWLNGEFMDNAFLNSEKAVISTTTVAAHANSDFDTYAGNTTHDKIFLLSMSEARDYFASDAERECPTTEYAMANGVLTNDYGKCLWWLRTPGDFSYNAVYTNDLGYVRNIGFYVDDTTSGIRPAMWIELNS